MTERVAVIGLGRMGRSIAQRLVKDGMAVIGWTRSGSASKEFPVAPSLQAAAADADVLILSLFDDHAVRSVLEQLASLDMTGRLLVETSTVSPNVVRDMENSIEAAGGRIIDAPISGGPEMVAAGTIGLYLGGADEDIARFMPLASRLSNRVLPVGPLGAGAAAKIVNNTALAGAFHAIVDAIQLGHAMGLQLDTMLAFLKESPATTPMFRARIPKMTGEDDTVGFTIEAVLKDNALFLQAAEAFGVDLPELRHARQRLEAAIDADLGGQDPAALVRFVLRDKRD